MDQMVRISHWFVAPEQRWQEGDAWTGLNIQRYFDVRNEFIKPPSPASTAMGVRSLLVKDCLVEIDGIAVIPGEGESIEGVSAPDIPKVIAGYSEAIKVGDWVFTCGEVPTDWKGDWMSSLHMGEPSGLAPEARVNPYHWSGMPIRKQTEYTLTKLAAIAEAAGSDLQHAVKATVYLPDSRDYLGFEEVWRVWFPEDPPARTIVPYTGLGPKGSRIEIGFECIMPKGKLKKETVATDRAPAPIGHEPQAVKAGSFLFLSGQMACDDRGVASEAVRDPRFPYHGSPGAIQTRHILNNVQAICEAAGTSSENICRRHAFYTDLNHDHDSVEQWVAQASASTPATTAIEVGGPLLVPGCEILLDLIAYIPD
jgi:enamine deaminase RidA (YjgF/YER057c/UK114 family)